MSFAAIFAFGLAHLADARLAGGGGGADADPPVEPAEISRDALGGDGIPAGRPASGSAADPARAVAAAWSCGRCDRAAWCWRWPSRISSAPGWPSVAGGRTHRVLVLDGSYSMAYKPTDKSRFEQAKELAARIVERARRATPSRWC